MKTKIIENGYIYVNLTEQSKFNLDRWMRSNKIPHKICKDNLHITLQQSKTSIQNYKIEKYNDIVTPKELKVFKCLNGNNALVLIVEGEKLKERREYSFKMGAVCNRESFEMHITLSYDVQSFKPDHIRLPQSAIFIQDERITDFMEKY